MTGNPQTRAAAAAPPASLTGAEKVAVLLLAIDRTRAANLLRRFEPEELKLLSRLSGDLQPITASDLQTLVEEFAHKFSSGVNFVGTEKEVKSLLSGIMSEHEQAEPVVEDVPAAPTEDAGVWQQVSALKDDVLVAYLRKEHPQTVALILTRIDSASAARVIGAFPAALRNNLLCRMLAIGQVAGEAVQAVEAALSEELLASTSSTSHAGIADILNCLDRTQTEAVLQSLSEVRPKDVKVIKRMLFTFEELATLPPKALSMVFDQVPIDRVVIALNGTDVPFQASVLSSLAARSRRMVEAELQGGSTAAPREVADARRFIVDIVLKLIAKGEVVLETADRLDDITV